MRTTIQTETGDHDVAITAGRVRRGGKSYAETYFSVDLDVHVLGSFRITKDSAGSFAALCAADETRRAVEGFEEAGDKASYLRALGFEI